MAKAITMPRLGESVVEGTIMRWLKHEGDPVEELEAIVEITTDKVASEIPAPANGVLLRISRAEGDVAPVGAILGWVGQPGEEPPPAEEESAPSPAQPAEMAPRAARTEKAGFISPVVARIAAERQVDLAQVRGTGEGGRITKKDVLAYLEQTPAAPWETPGSGDLFRSTGDATEPARAVESAPAPATGGQLLPADPMRRVIAARMETSARSIPQATTVMEADLTRVAAHREAQRESFERSGARLTFTAYFAAAAAAALKAHPLVNASWREDGVWLFDTVNLGLAVALGARGLVVPVLRRAEDLSLLGLARGIQDLARRARAGGLAVDELSGGTFTLTNHGVGGSLWATPLVNPPQCAILGVGAVQRRAMVVGDGIAIRPMVYLSLSFDHRILDGAAADAYLSETRQRLEDWPA